MSTLIIGDKQILPEASVEVTGYTPNNTAMPTSGRAIWVRRTGSIVTIQVECGTSTAFSPNVVSTAISGLPKSAVQRQELSTTVSQGVYARAWIDSLGNLAVFVSGTYTSSIFIGGTYITTD